MTRPIPYPRGRNTAAETCSIRLAEEALRGLCPKKAADAAFSILCDHHRMTPDILEELGNRLGRAAHTMVREGAS
jgi:hypothetical protein